MSPRFPVNGAASVSSSSSVTTSTTGGGGGARRGPPARVYEVPVAALAGDSLETVNGASLTEGSSADGGTVTVNGATEVATDVLASNGVLHVIGAVLLPPSP